MQIPSLADWGDIDHADPDAKWAFDTFLGKSLAEAEAMFERNALYYQEGLQSMPKVPFNFYAHAFVKYITSDRARGDSDGASSFLYLIFWLLKSNRTIMHPETEKALLGAASQISQLQEFYAADPDIYGTFAERYAEIEQLAAHGN
jgi:hypothetical protein